MTLHSEKSQRLLNHPILKVIQYADIFLVFAEAVPGNVANITT
jgi:hypothetical protein